MKKLMYLTIVAVACGVALWYHLDVTSGSQSVHDILAKAPELVGKETTVSGIAGHSIAILGVGGFEITGDDGSTLTVISSQGVPLVGRHVTVHGVLRQVFVAGVTQELVLIQDPPKSKKANLAP